MPCRITARPQPCLILLNGFPGVGKLTISQALQSSFPAGTKSHLIDVHMIIDAVGHGSDEIIIMTAGFANENAYDVEQWLDYARVAKERGGVMVHVNISSTLAINTRRLMSPQRVHLRHEADMGHIGGKMKSIDPVRLKEVRDTTTMLDPRRHASRLVGVAVKYVEMDNSDLSVQQSVWNIRWLMQQLGNLGKRGEGVECLGLLADCRLLPMGEKEEWGLKGDGREVDKRPASSKVAGGSLNSRELTRKEDPEREVVEYPANVWVDICA